jgi:hypothetical protein
MRVSEAAIQRDRDSSRNRARNNRDRVHKVQKEYRDRSFENRPFIGWDSEGYDYFIGHPDGTVEIGPQRTMLFGCSIPGEYIIPTDERPWLSTKEMLDLILRIESIFPDAFHVGFSFEYDINQILCDLPWRMLSVLKVTGKVRWNGYRITHIPHKILTVSKDGVAATIYDCFGYFHCKYTTALSKYHIGDRETTERIAKGKSRRGHFTWADIAEVLEYWKAEISLLPLLMEPISDAAYGGGFRIHAWHGPGSLASFALAYNGVRQFMSKKVPAYAQAAIRSAYAGGRFQAWRCGEYYGDIYTLDKNSAYIHAIAQLPRLDNGKWERIDPHKIHSATDIARFGLYHIVFDASDTDNGRRGRARGIPQRPYPLFHRDKTGKLTWPDRTDGWYWSPEAAIVADSKRAKFVEAIVYRDDGTYPFRWVDDSFEVRRRLQEAGNPAEKAYKWALAAMYGAFARRVGWDRKKRTAPRSHELAWAGYTTSHCRADIALVANYAASKGGLVSVDTDGVTSTVPFPEDLSEIGLSTGYGDRLGQWKQEHFSGLLYWQNGIYWLRGEDGKEWIEAKSRGVPKGVIPLETAQAALEDASFIPPYKPAVITIKKSRYVGYRQALNQQFRRWRVWQHEPFRITFGGAGKGAHFPPFCLECNRQRYPERWPDSEPQMHVITHIRSKNSSIVSEPHKLPWLDKIPDDMSIGDIITRDFIDREDSIYADADLEDNL